MKVHILLDRTSRHSEQLMHDIRTFFLSNARDGGDIWEEAPEPWDEDGGLTRLTIEFLKPLDAADFRHRPEFARWVRRS